MNAITDIQALVIDDDALKIDPEFQALIPPLSSEERAQLEANLVAEGCRDALVLWPLPQYVFGQWPYLLLDGHNRYEICTRLNIPFKTVNVTGIESREDALLWILRNQLGRRNLTDFQRAELALRMRPIVEARASEARARASYEANVGRPSKSRQNSAAISTPVETRRVLAESAGVSHDTLRKVERILDTAAPPLAEAARRGGISIHAASAITQLPADEQDDVVASGPRHAVEVAKDIREGVRPIKATPAPREKDWTTLEEWKVLTDEQRHAVLAVPGDKTFNKQDSDSIEWARWSWNPITGCRHDCSYCYARDIANRFYPQGFEPSILPARLSAPEHTKVPAAAEGDISYRNVFTCSMADLFGRWVPDEWIEAVLDQVRDNPQWNFLFLTKFPKRMAEFKIPRNAWMGTTVDLQARVKAAEAAFSRIECEVKWLSLEPMLQPLEFSRLDLFDWVVIGGSSRSSQTPEWVPPLDWMVRLHTAARAAGCRIYYKSNAGMSDALRIKEFPWGDAPEERVTPSSLMYLGRD